jgi:hypothetical protein
MCIRPLPYLAVEGPTHVRARFRAERLWCLLDSTRRTPVARKKQTPVTQEDARTVGALDLVRRLRAASDGKR